MFTDRIKILVLTIAAVVAMSCSKTETVPNGDGKVPMQFSSYAARSSSTRAGDSFVPVGATTLPDSTSFGVFAFYQQGVVGSTTAHWNDGGWHPAFMFDQEVEFDGSDYNYTPVKYWPANEENTISFWAYYPHGEYVSGNTGALKFYESDGTTAYTASSTGIPYVKYTVDRNSANQADLLFDSFAKKDMTCDNCMPEPGTVDLLFRHALALVEFQISEGEEAIIHSFQLTNLYWSGNCANPAASPILWTGQGSINSFTISEMNVTDSLVCRLLMIPQTLNASASITINYDISYPSFDPSYPDPIVYTGNTGTALLTDAGITSWEAGRHYVYKITAGFERVEFEEVVDAADDWSVGNGNITVSQ